MSLLKKLGWTAASALLASGLVSTAWAESAAERAVKEAQKYKGQTITIVWEAGLQSLDPLNFSGPLWEKLTGMKVKVIEVQTAEMFTKIMQEYRAGTGAYDALNVMPSWMPDLANAGALEPLDSYIDKYAYKDEFQKIAPIYRDNWAKANGIIRQAIDFAIRLCRFIATIGQRRMAKSMACLMMVTCSSCISARIFSKIRKSRTPSKPRRVMILRFRKPGKNLVRPVQHSLKS